MKKILFVCTGNICRSPTAHAIARHKAKILGLENSFIFDSAGTQGFHAGEAPDMRSMQVGKKRGISFSGIFSRKIKNSDFADFDFLMAMDRSHFLHLQKISPPEFIDKIKLFLPFCDAENLIGDEVIDPYYRADDSFDKVYDAIDFALDNFFRKFSK